MKRTLNVLSPSKENLCQDLKDSPSKTKHNSSIIQIIEYLKSEGIKLPQHLNLDKGRNPEDFEIKLKATNAKTSSNEVKNLKVKLSDTEFELKKIEEDFAQYKRNVKMEKDR